MRRPLAFSSLWYENWTRTGPLRLKSLRFAGLFRPNGREQVGLPPLARPRDPSFPDGICWVAMAFSSVKEGLGRPQPGSAIHHLVTALSVKKALMVDRGFSALSRPEKW
jgi:hypothetical protein